MLLANRSGTQVGNNRGNKYSKKAIHSSPTTPEFWDFSMDEFAFHDIPDTISYILDTTSTESLSYIGFSQGTAQAFAALSIHPKLNNQVNVFIALAPAMSPAGLSNGIVDSLVKASPQVLFLLFGRKSILSSTTMWQSILYPPIFVKVIDMALSFLFGWQTQNISMSQKLAAYTHLYSYTSTKSVVHWFQIIRNKSFQMYDDDRPSISLSSSKHTKVAKYPTRNIKTPIVLVYGGIDSLVDIKVMLKELPPQTIATEISHYEHLDFLWARDVSTEVFPHVFDALDSFTDAEHTMEEYVRYRVARSQSVTRSKLRKRDRASDDSDESTVHEGTIDSNPGHGEAGDKSQQKTRGRRSSIPSPKGNIRPRGSRPTLSSGEDTLPSSPEKPEGDTAPEEVTGNGVGQGSPTPKGPRTGKKGGGKKGSGGVNGKRPPGAVKTVEEVTHDRV